LRNEEIDIPLSKASWQAVAAGVEVPGFPTQGDQFTKTALWF